MRKVYAVLIATLALAATLRCSSDVAGTVTEQGNPIAVVQATFVDSTGQGQAQLQAMLYALDDTLRQDSQRLVATTRTDAQGTARFEAFSRGEYQISARSNDDAFAALSSPFAVEDQDVELAADTIAPSGALCVPVAIVADARVWVWLTGTPFTRVVQQDSVQFGSLPVDTYTVVVLLGNADGDGVGVGFVDTVVVEPGETVCSDTARLWIPAVDAPVLIDDNEDGTMFNNFGGDWWGYNDSAEGGNSSIDPFAGPALVDTPGYASSYAIHTSYVLGDALSRPHAGLGTDFHELACEKYKSVADFSAVDSISFMLRGPADTVKVLLHSVVEPQTWIVAGTISPLDSQW
ncbi:MAG: hypothetical protein GF331_05395, partial [Chitinivibrionales bacterium]|nr:hypothetical protein [Chitinivibrionales bacterium]